ncbi:hypothetical protein HOF92_02450, partial [bacterium]|nr:hypothetical protein [bacterium]
LLKTKRTQGLKLDVVEYRFDDPLREAFALKYLNLNRLQLEAYWRTRFLTVGQQDPVTKKNVRVVLKFLMRNPNYIGYCPKNTVLPKFLKVLEVRHY